MSLKKKPRRGNHQSEGSWAVSYVDMLTLLLCFFIIFYNNEKNRDDGMTPMQKIAMDLSGRKPSSLEAAAGPGAGPGNGTGNIGGTGAGPGTGSGVGGDGNQFGTNLWGKKTTAGTGNISVTPEDLALLELIKARIGTEVGAQLKMSDKSLELDFAGMSFFKSGQIKLLPEAEVQLGKVITLLDKYKDIVHITVQGHTDPLLMHMHKTKNTFSDNWELSALRATSVLKVFIKDGFPQQQLSAEGFADMRDSTDTKPIDQMTKEELANLRRITLRIEPLQVKK